MLVIIAEYNNNDLNSNDVERRIILNSISKMNSL